MSSRLIRALVSTDASIEAFSDRSLLQAMLAFEAALARAQAGAGVIPARAADAIARVAGIDDAAFDVDAIVRDARAQATPVIAVVKALTARVSAVDADAARYVHWGATSQDVIDTALVLCVRRAWDPIASGHEQIAGAMARLAMQHGDTVMLGRTLLQPAVPTTFGLKAAGWLGAAARAWRAWFESFTRLQVVQFGGAAGTLAALGADGPLVERALADQLELAVPDGPWHAHRDRVAAFVCACGVYAGSLAKVARDVSLLMQHEVAEVSEAGGGSSTMPQKRNPSRCAVAIAAAERLPGIVATVLAGMAHEHERAVGSWQGEIATVADAVEAADAVVAAIAGVTDGLRVDADRMRQNVEATRGGVVAESLSLQLKAQVGHERAAALVQQALGESVASNRSLAVVAAATPGIAAHLTPDALRRLGEPEAYLGSADVFRRRLMAAAAALRED